MKKKRLTAAIMATVLTANLCMPFQTYAANSIYNFSYDFESGRIPFKMTGNGAGASYLTINESGNNYWKYEASGKAAVNYSQLVFDQPGNEYMKAIVNFKWWPERNRNSSGSYGYVGLADSNGDTLLQFQNNGGGNAKNKLTFYDAVSGDATDIDETRNDFWGGGGTAIEERWYQVVVTFDFVEHQAQFSIANPEGVIADFDGIDLAEDVKTLGDFRVGWHRVSGTATAGMELAAVDDVSVTYDDDDDLAIATQSLDFEDGKLPTMTRVGGSNSTITINANKFLYHKVLGQGFRSTDQNALATPSQIDPSEDLVLSEDEEEIPDEDENLATPSQLVSIKDSLATPSQLVSTKDSLATPSQLLDEVTIGRVAMTDFKLPALSKAEYKFRWWPEQNSDSFSGITFLNDDMVLLQLQNVGGVEAQSELKYKVGEESEEQIASIADGFYGGGIIALAERWYDVEINFDFTNRSVNLKIVNPEYEVFEELDLELPYGADTADVMTMGWYGENEPVEERMAIDNFSGVFILADDNNIAAVSSGSESFLTVYSGDGLDFTQSFPTSVQVFTEGGATDTVPLGSWIPEQPFDSEKTGTYIYQAPLELASTSYKNSRNLKAEFKVHYLVEDEAMSEYDFYDDFSQGIWTASSLNTVHNNKVSVVFDSEDIDGNPYLSVTGQNGVPNNRTIGSLNKVISSSHTYESATVVFDWLPVSVADFIDVTMFSSEKSNSLFTVTYSNLGELLYFTDGAYTLADGSSTDGFDGNLTRVEADTLCAAELDEWLKVRIDLNFDSHLAAVRVYDRDSDEVIATADGIAIDPDARNVNRMAFAGQIKEIYNMGIDNVGINFQGYDDAVIIAINSLPDVTVAKDDYLNYISERMPQTITAVVAGNQEGEAELSLGTWECQPAFEEGAFGNYVWTAEILPGGYRNSRDLDLTATFNMEYTSKRYAVSAENPAVSEIRTGAERPAFPETAKVVMSNGEKATMPLDAAGWTEVNGAIFPDSGERVYIYKTKLSDSADCINKDGLTVEWRVNYFDTNDNYNGNVRSMEYLDRGVYAVPAKNDNGILVSWRLLATEYNSDIEFNVYRNGVQVNDMAITSVTNYTDSGGQTGDSYVVESISGGQIRKSDSFTALSKNYISIPLQVPDEMPSLNRKYGRTFSGETKPIASYEPLEGGVADVDGDGEYELIVKWLPTNSFDPGQGGETSSSSPMMYDCMKLDGTVLWRLNLGYSASAGSHWSPFIFYDLDEDGKAEFSIITADGSTMYRPDENGRIDITREDLIVGVVGNPELEGQDMQLNGMPTATTNVYVTSFEGLTGNIIDTIDFPVPTGAFEDWGDSTGNRANRYNATVAYIPAELGDSGCTETIPALCFNRGYYLQTSMSVLTLREGSLNLEWSQVFESDSVYAHRGNHYNNTGDIDNDGFDEIIIGSMAFDHDGEVLWVKNGENGLSDSGHGDANHLAAMMQNSDQLYFFQPFESGLDTFNYEVVNASNGAYLGGHYYAKADIGRGVAANLTPAPGYEFWAQVPNVELETAAVPGGIYNINGYAITDKKPDNFMCAWRVYWDGDLLSELPDGRKVSTSRSTHTVYKYNWEENRLDVLESFEGAITSNGTRNSPVIGVDILGDWREEIISRSADLSELRIYCTGYDTEYMIYTLMHDPVYRNAVASQNSSYNQPPAVGFYLGEDEDGRNRVLDMGLPVPNISYTSEPGDEETEPEVTGIRMGDYPKKLVYKIGESLDVSGGTLVVKYDDNTEKVISIANDMVSGYDAYTIGTQKIKVEYDGFVIEFEVIVGNEIAGIRMGSYPSKLVYKLGEELNLSGGTLVIEFEDGTETSVMITENMVSGYLADIAGTHKIKVSYQGFAVEFEVTVEADKKDNNSNHSSSSGSGGNDAIKIGPANGTVVAGNLNTSLTGLDSDKDGKWKNNSSGWWFELTSGSYSKNQWAQIDHEWYLFDSEGYMRSGWTSVAGKWYYLHESGKMAHTSWIRSQDNWYYLNADGTMSVGWVLYLNNWYYLSNERSENYGKMLYDTRTPDGYYVGKSGIWVNHSSQ